MTADTILLIFYELMHIAIILYEKMNIFIYILPFYFFL